jgi:zinc protease
MVDRSVAPDFVKSTSFDLINPERLVLANNLELFLVPGGSQDVLKIELVFNAGRWYETKWGSAFFTSTLLNKGTKSKTSFDIAQIFDTYGAHIDISPGLDFVSVSLYTLTKHLSPVLNLLFELLTTPSFPEKEFTQSKTVYLQNLKVNHEKTSFLASKHFRKSLFGDHHPYGKELEEADIEKLTTPDFNGYFNSFFQTFKVFVSGRWDEAARKNIVDTFGRWTTKPSSEKKLPTSVEKPVQQYVDKEGSVQSSIRVGGKSVLRSHSDYVKSIFVAHILGGYFGSRLMKNIREEKGLTYGIHSSIHAMKNESYLVIGADVNKENVELTFEEIRKELRRLRLEKISADELDTARNHFIGSLQSEITTPFAHADKLKTIHLFNLPTNYYQQMIDVLVKISANDIAETGEKYFNEKNFFEVAVG